MTTFNHDLNISGALTAGNIHSDQVRIEPVADSPTSVTVTGFELTGTGEISVQATAYSAVAGSTFEEVTYSQKSSTDLTLNVYRGTDTSTILFYFLIQKP